MTKMPVTAATASPRRGSICLSTLQKDEARSRSVRRQRPKCQSSRGLGSLPVLLHCHRDHRLPRDTSATLSVLLKETLGVVCHPGVTQSNRSETGWVC